MPQPPDHTVGHRGAPVARRLLVTLLLIVSLSISIAAGIIAADWPAWKRLFLRLM